MAKRYEAFGHDAPLETGPRPAKTRIFARNHEHAKFIEASGPGLDLYVFRGDGTTARGFAAVRDCPRNVKMPVAGREAIARKSG